MPHGLTLKRRLSLISRAAAGRPKTRNHPGTPPRPIRITYNGDNPCDPNAGDERIIEVHNIQPSEAGNIVIDAWCRLCGKVERFRLDRITSHRTLRAKLQGPTPPGTPYFTALGPVGIDQLTRPITANPTTAGLVSRARARVAEAERFRQVFGPAESYPRRTIALTTGDLLAEIRTAIRHAGHDTPDADAARFGLVFGSPLAYPERRTTPTTAGLLSHARARVAEAERFRQVFGPAESYPRRTIALTTGDV
ncbi:hypothetical protein ACFV42_48115, partial [Streptomyces solisilvae]|uniref:hypothetical protein n=1 Tax=Streptomyces malaysiensis TaxID=92644 RepID=UPI0036A3E101